MSGFALIYNRDGSRAEPDQLTAMMAHLAHRGWDGQDKLFRHSVASGHMHFWTTPEEVGERQPLSDAGEHFDIVFDGRLDNRKALVEALGLDAEHGRTVSDARLVLLAYARWGVAGFERFLGSFALVIYDHVEEQVVCVRDALGDRTLYYAIDSKRLIVASEAYAVTAHRAVTEQVDETRWAYHFAGRAPADGRTFFVGVSELLPAHVMVVNADSVQTLRYWTPDLTRRIRYRSDAEYAEHYRALLAESVHCRLRSPLTPAVMMSGGLDSTSVAAMAAQELQQRGDGEQLRTFSWVFDELTSCDERYYMDAMIERHNLDAIRVIGDDCWPLHDLDGMPFDPSGPAANPYRALKDRLYQRASDEGVNVLLTGDCGDELYVGAHDWLTDLVLDRRPLEAYRELNQLRGHIGWRGLTRRPDMRRVGGRILEIVPFGRRLHPYHLVPTPPWLTEYAKSLILEADLTVTIVDGRSYRMSQQRALLGLRTALRVVQEHFYANRHGTEIRYPYRDRRLVEYMLAVPSHQMYYQGRFKYVLRNALSGMLPDEVRSRPAFTSLEPLFSRGLEEREQATVQRYLQKPNALWTRFIRPESLIEASLLAEDGPERLVTWWSVAGAIWQDARKERLSS